MDFIAIEFPGLFDGKDQAQSKHKAFSGEEKSLKSPISAIRTIALKKPIPAQGLQKADLVVDQSILQPVNRLVERLQECVQMLLVFLGKYRYKGECGQHCLEAPFRKQQHPVRQQ